MIQLRDIQLIKGLEGTKVTADDFFITGKDDTEHNVNLHMFLMRCRERNLVLNPTLQAT